MTSVNLVKMTKVILTRYLYQFDEVCLSLQQALLSKTSFEEVVFWVSELFESGFHTELWHKGFEIYYNFYAITYPKYEKKLNKLYKEFDQNPKIQSILNLFTILYYSKVSLDVFKINVLIPRRPKKIYITKPA